MEKKRYNSEKLQQPRSYIVKTEQGLIIRNRRHLLKTQEKINNPITNKHNYENIFNNTKKGIFPLQLTIQRKILLEEVG